MNKLIRFFGPVLVLILLQGFVYGAVPTIDLDLADSNKAIDISNGGTNARTVAGARLNLGLGVGDDVSFKSLDASSGKLSAAGVEVTKKWLPGLPYLKDVTSVIHGGIHYICIANHTAGTSTEPGVGASWKGYWKPASSFPSVLDYGADPTGVIGSSGAFANAIAANPSIYVPPGTYLLKAGLSADNKRIYGAGADGTNHTKLVGHADIPASTPLISIGRTSIIEGMEIGYASGVITGSEAQDERIGIYTKGASYLLQRGSSIRNVVIKNVGTAIGDKGQGAFSVSFSDIEIGAHSYAAVDIRGATRTGNVWSNIYINGGDTYSSPKYGFNSEGGESDGIINQLNIEHQSYTDAALRLDSSQSLTIGAVHIEGVDLSTSGKGYVEINQSGVNIGSLTVINTRMSQDNTSIVKLLDARYSDTASPADYSKSNTVRIDNYHTKSLARPNTSMYPDYPAERTGLDKVVGFEHFSRPDTYTDDHYNLSVGAHNWLIYSADTTSKPFLKYAWERYSNLNKNINLLQFGRKGEAVHPRKNLIANGDMKLWTNESASATTSTYVQAATNSYISATSGTITAVKVDSGYRQVSDSHIKVSNVGTVGNYQNIHWRISDWKKIIGKEVTLSFEAKASVAGRRLEQISLTLDNTGGTGPTTTYNQIISGSDSSANMATTWQYYSFTKTLADETGLTAVGSSPFYRLHFSINDAAGSRESEIEIRNVKLEIGPDASQFSAD